MDEVLLRHSLGYIIEASRESGFKKSDFQLENPFQISKKLKKSNFKTADFLALHLAFLAFLDESIRILLKSSKPLFPLENCGGGIKAKTSSDSAMAEMCKLWEIGTFSSAQPFEEIALNQDCSIDFIFGILFRIEKDLVIKALDSQFKLPSPCEFLISSFSRLPQWLSSIDPFDLIVMDPPWANASAQRSQSYDSLDCYELFKIPIKRCLTERGVVAIWVTNNPKYNKFVTKKLIPDWGLKLISTWFWIKVTNNGELIFDLDSMHRKPYEILYIASKIENPLIPKNLSLISVPAAHSRKPPLRALFSDHLDGYDDMRKLELFARQARKDWTCWGNESIKFNNVEYYENVK